jgi:hypothetical protein
LATKPNQIKKGASLSEINDRDENENEIESNSDKPYDFENTQKDFGNTQSHKKSDEFDSDFMRDSQD